MFKSEETCAEVSLLYSKGLEAFLDYIRDCKQQYAVAESAEQNANNEIQDLLHAIELGENTDDQLILLSKSLKASRLDRRQAKNTITTLQPLLDWASENLKCINDLTKVLGTMRKEEKRLATRIYVNRTEVIEHLDDFSHPDDSVLEQIQSVLMDSVEDGGFI